MLKPDFTKYDSNSGAETIFNIKTPKGISDGDCKNYQDTINIDDMLSFIELFIKEKDNFEKKDSITLRNDDIKGEIAYSDKARFGTYNYGDMYIYNITIMQDPWDDEDDDRISDTVLVLERNGKYVYGGSEGAHACFGNNRVSYSHSHGENDFVEEKIDNALDELYDWIKEWAING